MHRPLHRQPLRSPRVLRLALASACAALCGGWAGLAHAQSLQALYDAAQPYDAAVQSARSQADASAYKAEQSWAARRPSVAAKGTLAAARSNTPWSGVNRNRTFQQAAEISAQQSLFNRANDRAIDQAERGIDVARAQLSATEQDLMVRLTQNYFDLLSASDALDTVRASKTAIAEQLASAKRNFEVGTATITDTREAQARFDLARAQEIAAENDLNDKKLALDQLVGRQGTAPRPLATPVVLPTLAPADVDEWVRQAEDNNPSLRQLRLALDVARLETEKARAGALPTVGVSAAITTTNTNFTGDGRHSSGTGLGGNVGLQVNMPLFSGGAIENRIKETLSLEDKARTDLEAARRNVTQGVRTAFFGVQSLRARIGALEAAESSSKLALEATQLGYKVGVRVNLDVLNAQTQLYTAQRDLAKARYDLLVNSVKLRQAAGILQAQDLAAVSALLAR